MESCKKVGRLVLVDKPEKIKGGDTEKNSCMPCSICGNPNSFYFRDRKDKILLTCLNCGHQRYA